MSDQSYEVGAEGSEEIPTFDTLPEQVKIGETVVSRDDLGKHYETYSNDDSWKRSNTEKAQAIARERELLDSTYGKYREFDEMVKAKPGLYEKLEQVAREFASPQSQAPGAVPPELSAFKSEAEQTLNAIKQEQQVFKINQDMEALEKQFPGFFEGDSTNKRREVIEHCVKNNIDSVFVGFRDMYFDKARELGMQTGQEKVGQAKERSQRLGMPKGSSAPPKAFSAKGKSESEVLQAMMNHPAADNLLD